MKHGSLFTGIGGFDLAAQWMGWENVFQVEWDGFCQKVLAKNFPNVKRYGDIKEFDGTKYRGLIDIISGGFPCQPYSLAGKRKGKADDRHLWPEMLRIIGEVQPGWVVGENVSGIINWSGGLVFHEVQTDLEAKGYEIFPVILPAISVNAPHKRERIWFIAYSKSRRLETSNEQYREINKNNRTISSSFNTDITTGRLFRSRNYKQIRRGNGVSNWMDRLKGLGNAIVPQVAFQIFKAIEQYNEVLNN
jgi:DNA (cytosine-5)-methyltransferase 1